MLLQTNYSKLNFVHFLVIALKASYVDQEPAEELVHFMEVDDLGDFIITINEHHLEQEHQINQVQY